MSIPFGQSIDLVQNELQNARIQNLAADPATPVEGQVYYKTSDHFPRIHNGTAFKQVPFVDADTPTAEGVASTASVGSSGNAARADHRHAMPDVATTGASGFMSSADKTKLDNATSVNTASRLVIRDAAGRAQFADPSAAQDAATKAYVDSVAQGLDIKASVRVATTAAGTLATSFANGQTVDGVVLATGDRILIKNQAAPAENGVYTVNASGAPTRATDADTWAELLSAFVFVEVGTTNADTGWTCTIDAGGTLETTTVTFAQFSGAGSFSAANDAAVTGQGVYDNTSGTQFRFRGIKAASSKVAVALATKDITIDVAEANLTHDNIGGTLGVAKGGTGATTAAGAKTNLGFMTRYVVAVGNGVLTTIPVTHSLNTLYPMVQVWEAGGSKREIFCEKVVVDANTVNLIFATAPASNAYNVVVIG